MKPLVAFAAFGLSVGCTSYVKPLPPAPAETRPAVASLASKSPRMTSLSTVTMDVPIGAVLGEAQYGYSGSCSNATPLTYRRGTVQPNIQFYAPVFKEVMDELGVPVQQTTQRFEGEEIKKADLQVAATVTEMVMNLCYPELGKDEFFARGQAFVKVDWAVFSPLEKTVVYSATTTGRTPAGYETRLGEGGLIREAFRDALRTLAAKTDFGATLVEIRAAETVGATIDLVQPARMQGSISDQLPGIRSSVVTIRTNAGEGTGFAVGDGSFVITAAHVVSGGGTVKLLAGNSEAFYGEVVRKSAGRDVALIKLQKGSLRPLHLSTASIREGDDIYAVGSPLGQKFDSSVTRGVVSSIRKYEGREYIQSDVNVLPGSSGGPLLDQHGNVIGVTSAGLGIAGVPVGLNLFVPVASVIDSLSLATVNAPASQPLR